MNKMNVNREEIFDQLIDRAVKEFPLEPPPPGLKTKIMQQIETPLPQARFKISQVISWVDIIFSGTLALIFWVMLEIYSGLVHSPYWSTRLRIRMILFWQDIKYFFMHNQSSLMAILLSGGMVMILLMVLTTIYRRYATYTSKQPV